ncbi:hypothetical protein, partial [Nocardia mangyaensis]|uniref:hypothetical protein n=1 Tax=Nocardia mangyaensis TaxID=2213200 RepID=UPI002676CBB5
MSSEFYKSKIFAIIFLFRVMLIPQSLFAFQEQDIFETKKEYTAFPGWSGKQYVWSDLSGFYSEKITQITMALGDGGACTHWKLKLLDQSLTAYYSDEFIWPASEECVVFDFVDAREEYDLFSMQFAFVGCDSGTLAGSIYGAAPDVY